MARRCFECFLEFIKKTNGKTIDRNDGIPGLKAGFFGGHPSNHFADRKADPWHQVQGLGLIQPFVGEILGHSQLDFGALPNQGHFGRTVGEPTGVVDVFYIADGGAVQGYQAIARSKAQAFGPFGGCQAVFEPLDRGFLFSPNPEDHREKQNPKNSVDGHTANHDNQALPCWLGTKFIRTRGGGQLFLVHRFVDHAGDFHISADG